jgi:hypothetical protein
VRTQCSCQPRGVKSTAHTRAFHTRKLESTLDFDVLNSARGTASHLRKIDSVEVDDIFGYDKLVAAEKATLQKGMNYRVGKDYSVFLMSLRENAPYADALDEITGMLTYEGHDEPQRQGGPNPKEVDQPLTTPKGSWTENGKFFRAAMDSNWGAHASRVLQNPTPSKENSTSAADSDNICPVEGARVLILTGQFKGEEGICLGQERNGRWVVSPDGSDEIASLIFDREFALLIDLSMDPIRN